MALRKLVLVEGAEDPEDRGGDTTAVEVRQINGHVARVYVRNDQVYPMSDWSWVHWFAAGAISLLGLELVVLAMVAAVTS